MNANIKIALFETMKELLPDADYLNLAEFIGNLQILNFRVGLKEGKLVNIIAEAQNGTPSRYSILFSKFMNHQR